MNNINVITIEGCEDRLPDLHERLEYGGLKDYQLVNGTNSKDIEDYIKSWEKLEGGAVKYKFGRWWKDPRLKNMKKNISRIACFSSHYDILNKYKIPTIICEDDIYFKKKDIVPNSLDSLPDDCFMAHWDATHIELFDPEWLIEKSSGWYRIEPDKARIWCAGCYWIKDPQKVIEILNKEKSKVYDKCLIEYIHSKYPCYIWLSGCCYQDRKSFNSSIS